MNDKLEGFRGLLTILGTWAMLVMDTFLLNATGFSPEALKIAAIATAPISAKLIWTDAKPRIMRWITGESK